MKKNLIKILDLVEETLMKHKLIGIFLIVCSLPLTAIHLLIFITQATEGEP